MSAPRRRAPTDAGDPTRATDAATDARPGPAPRVGLFAVVARARRSPSTSCQQGAGGRRTCRDARRRCACSAARSTSTRPATPAPRSARAPASPSSSPPSPWSSSCCHPAHRAPAALGRLGGGARPGPRRRAGQPRRPVLPRAGRRARATSSTGSACSAPTASAGRSSTSPTPRIVVGARSWPRLLGRAAAIDVRRPPARRRDAAGRCVSTRLLPVPDGLDGLRLDVAIVAPARLLAHRGRRPDRRRRRQRRRRGRRPQRDRVHAGSLLEVTLPEPAPDRRRRRSRSTAWSCLRRRRRRGRRQAGRRRRPPEPGLDRPDRGAGPGRHGVPARRRRARPSGRASCTASTSARPGRWCVAKSERAYTALKRAFQDRTVDKRYRALVQGHPDPTRGTIDAPIDRHPRLGLQVRRRRRRAAPSVTHYETAEAFRAATLLDVHLETGRTHQIRVHMAAMRHPCVGDLTYGADPVLAKRLGPDPAVAARPRARLRAPRHRRGAAGRARRSRPTCSTRSTSCAPRTERQPMGRTPA